MCLLTLDFSRPFHVKIRTRSAESWKRKVLSLIHIFIFTIRTKKEGGQAELSKKEYFFINRLIAEAGIADVMDIEAFDAPEKVDERTIRKFIALAHKHHAYVLLSNHDFEGTPDLVEMMTRFFVMQELGGDLMKLAVMPKKEEDVFCLLEVAALMRDTYGEIPFIAVAMGKLGATTRICGGEFGSVITFASGAEASAPGQLDAATPVSYTHLDVYKRQTRTLTVTRWRCMCRFP